jgi:hypothetical protein
METRCRASPL